MAMAKNFDYDLSNYTKLDLEEMLELPSNYTYDVLMSQGKTVIYNISVDRSLSEETRERTTGFIQLAIEELSRFYESNVQPNSRAISESVNDLNDTYRSVYNMNRTLMPTPVFANSGHMIQKASETPYGISYPSETFAGTLNPLNRRTLQKNLNIDTRFRENYFTTPASNFNIDVNGYFNDCVSMQLAAFEMPGSLYAVSKVFGNNFFCIRLADVTVPPLIVTIPDGNYDSLSMQNYLNYFLSQQTVDPAYSSLAFLADNNNNGTMPNAGSGGSGKMVVGIASTYVGEPFSFTLDFTTDIRGNPDVNNPMPLKFGWLIGFRQGIYENNNNYVSEGLIQIVGPKYIYLVVEDFNNNLNDGFFSAFNNSVLNKNILARISLLSGNGNGNGSSNTYISQNNLSLITTPRRYFGPVDLQRLHVQLLDEYGRTLDLNNMDYSFCLTVTTVYDI